MSRGLRLGFGLMAGLLLTGLLAAPASAQSSSDTNTQNDQIVLSGHLIVAQGDTVDSAVLFHGTANIAGTVNKSLVVFDGPTDISGHIVGNVVVFNGAVTVHSGAKIDGNLVTGQTPTVEQGAAILGQRQRVSTQFNGPAVGFASRIAWWIGYSISTLVLGLLLLLFAPALDGAITRAERERTGASIGWGIGVFFLLPIAAVLLLVTVIALPLGIFTLLALALLYTVGYVVGSLALGRLIVKPPTSRFLAFLVGWVILRAVGLIPGIGGIAWVVASVFGLGLLWVAARRKAPAEALPVPAPPPPPPMPA
jgi:hypothetical protein